jgi:hypothetical protein
MNERLRRARDFVYCNARLVERLFFARLFEGGEAGPVLQALAAHQNPDGGFGNALEPDMRGPESQPMHVEMALRVLDEIGEFCGPVLERSVDWLRSISCSDGGIPWALKSVTGSPHASWWSGAGAAESSLGSTSPVLQLLMKNGVSHPIVGPALEFVRQRCASPKPEDIEYHMLRYAGEVLKLSGGAGDADLLVRLFGLIRERGLVAETDPDEPYAHTPLHWARDPFSAWRPMFTDDEIERDLRALADRQEADGSWPLGFPLTSPAAEYEWKGRFTIDALRTLQLNGMLD